MAIVLKQEKLFIKIDSNKIIGIMGKNYYSFIKAFHGEKIGYLLRNKSFSQEKVYNELYCYYQGKDNDFEKDIKYYLNELNYKDNFLDKKIKELSDSEKRIISFLSLLISDYSIIVIDDVYQYLDYFYKKKIKYLIKKLVRETKKTVIIGSNKGDDIYDICEKVLLLDNGEYAYGNVNEIFSNKSLLQKYEIKEPEIIKFISLCKNKNINIQYTNDIRDLIKEVYRNV